MESLLPPRKNDPLPEAGEFVEEVMLSDYEPRTGNNRSAQAYDEDDEDDDGDPRGPRMQCAQQ